MLTPHSLRSSSNGGARKIVNYVMERDTTEYYSENEAVQATWFGPGCVDFGLEEGGKVDLKQFESMLNGFDPNGQQFTKYAPEENHMPGLDMTFSSPKTLSMTRALADGAEREELDRIILEARQRALNYAVETGAFVYRQKGQQKPARPVFAMFSHHSNRDGDMQEHYHCIALNATKDAEGMGWRLEFNPVFQKKIEIGNMMRAFEAAALQEAGYTIERDGFSYRIVGSFTKAEERIFSKGAERIIAEVGVHASAKSKEMAGLETRGKKIVKTPAESEQAWRDELLLETGRVAGDVSAKIKGDHELTSEARRPKFDLTEIIDELSTRGVYFRQSDLEKEITGRALGFFSLKELDEGACQKAVAAALASERLVPVYFKEEEEAEGAWMHQSGGLEALSDKLRKQAEKSYADWKFKEPELAEKYSISDYVTYTQEQRAADPNARKEQPKQTQLGWASRETIYADMELARFTTEAREARLTGKSKHVLPKELVDKAIADFESMKRKDIPDFKISKQQRAAIYHMTLEGDLAIIEGVAGAGKSTFLYPVARAYEAAGYKVIGVTFQNTNAAALGDDAGIDSYTLDKFGGLVKVADGPQKNGAESLKIDEKTVVLLDEAAQVGGQKMYRTVQAVEKAGAKLGLSGHNAQSQAIAGTASFKLMREQAGEGGSYYLSETQRQIDKAHGEALTELSEGNSIDAWIKHAENGHVYIVEGEGVKEAAAGYHKKVEEVGADRAFVLCDTNAMMRKDNNEIRANLKKAGVVSERDFTAILTDRQMNEYETEIAVGDRIITREKVKDEKAIQNGVVWRVTDIDEVSPGRLKIGMERADGEPVDKRTGRKRVEIDTAQSKNFHMSYAMTISLSQGRTKDDGVPHHTSPDQFENSQDYVAWSRFKKIPHIMISEHLVAELARKQNVEIKDPRDMAEAAPILATAAEDQSRRKSHVLDFRLDDGFKLDTVRDAALFEAQGKREQDKIAAEKVATAANNARINAEQAQQAAKDGRQAQGRDDTAPLSKDGKLAEEERGKFIVEGALIAKTDEQKAADVAAFEKVGAARTAAKAAQPAKRGRPPKSKAAPQEPGEASATAEQVLQEPPPVKARLSLTELTAAARAKAQQDHADELAAKSDRAVREMAQERVSRQIDRAEAAWRALPADAPAEQIETAATARQEAREAYRGILPTEDERQAWDLRNQRIDLLDASAPAGKRQAEIEAERNAEALAQQQAAAEAARTAEEARQKGRGLSRFWLEDMAAVVGRTAAMSWLPRR